MWASMLHLALGNAFIGMAEGILIAKWFKLPRNRCVGWMIGANYLSAWAGMFGLKLLASKLDWNLYNAWPLLWLFVAIAFLGTLLLEWPLVALCFWKEGRWIGRSVKATLLVQSISYLVLFTWYWAASVKTLFAQVSIVPANELHLPPNLRLFYISSKSGQVCEGTQIVSQMTSSDLNDRLLFVVNPDQTNTWSLQLQPSGVVVNPTIQGVMATDESRLDPNQRGRITRMSFGNAVRLDPAKTNNWEFRSGFWAAEGLRGNNSETGERLRVAWETPFADWVVRNAIQLPDERIIFQLGYDQICLLDPETRRVALLARGRGPAVLLE